MSSKSLNKVMLIGNLTRDPELKYTPQGTAVCTFGVATNREWTDSSGQKKEDAQFHRLVAWGKLAEICAEILNKGRKVYIQGRLQTRSWQTNEGQDRQSTEVVVDEMIALGAPRGRGDGGGYVNEDFGVPATETTKTAETTETSEDVFNPEGEVVEKAKKTTKSPTKESKKEAKQADVNDDIPF